MSAIIFDKNSSIESYWGNRLEKEFRQSHFSRKEELEVIQNYIDMHSKDIGNIDNTDENIFFKESKKFLKETFTELKNRKPISLQIDRSRIEEQGINLEKFNDFISHWKSILIMRYEESRQFLYSVNFTDFCIKEFNGKTDTYILKTEFS